MTPGIDPTPGGASSPSVARPWPKILAGYRRPSLNRGLIEIAVTALPLAGLWAAMSLLYHVSYLLCLATAVPAAFFVVRLFMIQHDCSHDAFFLNRTTNDWVGRVIGVFTLTPHDYWRRSHAIHHATVGNLDQRGIGDVTTLTVAEYRALGWRQRLAYRLYRHPAILFGAGPLYLFVLQQRLPVGLMRGGWRPWLSTMGTNVAIGLVVAGLSWWIGLVPFLMIHLPVVVISSSVGVWLFYVQHQFENTTWAVAGEWSHANAALHGSSHYDLPGVLRWLTANIGMHHVHHLNSRIPFYRLPEVIKDHPELREVGRLTLWQSLGCVPLVLWDEGGRRLVSFKTARRLRQAASLP